MCDSIPPEPAESVPSQPVRIVETVTLQQSAPLEKFVVPPEQTTVPAEEVVPPEDPTTLPPPPPQQQSAVVPPEPSKIVPAGQPTKDGAPAASHRETLFLRCVADDATRAAPPPIPRFAKEQQQEEDDPNLTMEDVMRNFLEYEKSLTIPDFIKRFYQIRLEQEAIRCDEDFYSEQGCYAVHCGRNRYRDILPYDYNRVVLSPNEENANGYMNASYIALEGGATRFIAAQAPLSTTLEEWWRMVDEQKVTLIVMLCRLVEMGKVKCERYWPAEKGAKEIFGDYEITFQDEETFAEDDEYVLRTLIMDNHSSGETRTIQHLHYREWPDHGCPSGQRQLLNMIDKMAELHQNKDIPVLVHCSAGVGRTGTIIAVNYVRELMESGKLRKLDMFELVVSLRKQRASMVQTQDQYQFVHKCVAFYCRKRLGLPEPEPPVETPKPSMSPVRAFIAAGSPPALQAAAEDSSDSDEGTTVVPDFPHEPPAPRGPEELGSAAS